MPKYLKWALVILAWALVPILAIFVNPRISSFLADQITYGLRLILLWPFVVDISRIIVTIITNIILLVADVAIAFGVMTWLGFRRAANH